ncbi:putative lrr receptor-like serine/threonine-protein kinase [Quercus suber]|uniref:Lrr receptor-like serine/threonine-protein kinase n=1 Tax=Quercus suber TaxID=58331 RepID=A0AAW0JMD1_QUESU
MPLKLFDEISSSEMFTRLEIDFGIQPYSLLLSNVRNCNELPNWNSQKLPVSWLSDMTNTPSLSFLKDLTLIDLRQNNFGGEIPDLFPNLTKLTDAYMSDNQLTGKGGAAASAGYDKGREAGKKNRQGGERSDVGDVRYARSSSAGEGSSTGEGENERRLGKTERVRE